ncbi:hypothetical protein BGZ83_005154 [Gryganskiella cystojenkinii]|nr:hypothetical protein BGZ83_005154 [Gryganskiella cystojenkinii]
MIDKSEILIRPYTDQDYDQVLRMLMVGFSPIDGRLFRKKATSASNILSILSQSIIYTSLIELGLTAYRSSLSISSSFSIRDLEILKETLLQPETAEGMILKFLNRQFIFLWVIVTMIVTTVQLFRLYKVVHTGTGDYMNRSLKDDLGDISGYYQTGRLHQNKQEKDDVVTDLSLKDTNTPKPKKSTPTKENDKTFKDRSQFWVACLRSHPQVILGCIALEDLYAHRVHVQKMHEINNPNGGPFQTPSEKDSELRRMSVHPDYRRLGIGKMMLETLRDHAKAQGFKRVLLSTTFFQTEAIAGYEKFGFKKEKVVELDAHFHLWFAVLEL